MILRARHLFFAWLTYGALQLALLGVPAASSQFAVEQSAGRTQPTEQVVAVAKRFLAPDGSAHRDLTPFAPSAVLTLGLSSAADVRVVSASPRRAPSRISRALPPARAPPARA